MLAVATGKLQYNCGTLRKLLTKHLTQVTARPSIVCLLPVIGSWQNKRKHILEAHASYYQLDVQIKAIAYWKFLLRCWPCCLVPFCIPNLNVTEHYCSNCGRLLGKYKGWKKWRKIDPSAVGKSRILTRACKISRCYFIDFSPSHTCRPVIARKLLHLIHWPLWKLLLTAYSERIKSGGENAWMM